MWNQAWVLLWRGTLLHCPNCGKAPLFKRLLSFHMYERCPNCGWLFEREEGYWTGAMALNLIVTETLVAAFIIPLAALIGLHSIPALPVIVIGLPLPIVLPILFYKHSKSYWMTIDFLIHPAEYDSERERLRPLRPTR